MHWEYLCCIVYFSIAFRALGKWNFFTNSGLCSFELRLFLTLKLVVSCIVAYYFTISNHPDYLSFNSEGYAHYHLLISNPSSFFSDWVNDINNYGGGGFLSASHSFWANLRFSMIYKMLAIIDILTHGNFYLNSIVFASLVFVGNVCFFKIFNAIYTNQKSKIIFTTFFIPSMMLYTSSPHKDGFAFICIAIISYLLFYVITKKMIWHLKDILLITSALFFLLLIRNYVFIALFVATVLALSYRYFERNKILALLIIYLSIIFLFFAPLFNNNLAQSLTNRKQEFLSLPKGNTFIETNELSPKFQSFVYNLPQAINHSFFRPYLFEFKGWAVNFSAMEILLYVLIFLLLLLFKKKTNQPLHWFNLYGLSLAFHLFIIVGYTIPNVGAIVRYRSVFWVFLITPVVCNIDWNRIYRLFVKPKTNFVL